MRDNWMRATQTWCRPRRARCWPLTACGGGDIDTADQGQRGGGRRAGGDCGEINMAVNPWVGYEADAYVVGAVAEQELGCTVELQGPEGGRLLAGLRHRRGRRHHRGLGPPGPGEEVLRRAEGDGSAMDLGEPGNVGIIGWYVPPWIAEEHPDILDYENLNKYAKRLRDLRVGRPGPVPRRRPVLRAVRRGDREQPRPRLQGRLLRQRGRQHHGIPEGRGEQGVPDRLLLRAAVALRRDADWSASTCRRTPTAARPTRPRSRATTPRPPLKKIALQARAWTPAGPAADLLEKFSWTNEDQNLVAKYISEDGMSPEDAAAKWVEENADKVAEWTS